MRVTDLIRMRERGEKIVMATAYDYPSAVAVDTAGVDVILVGDSLATVIQGHESTVSVTLAQMKYHGEIVCRAASRALVVVDLPFMSYQLGPKEALASAGELIKERAGYVVKLEGGVIVRDAIARIVDAGIPVMGHVGLTPQSFHAMGGHRVQGKSERDAERVFRDAEAVSEAGACAIVLEGIPEDLAKRITAASSIPTIGIGAGPFCDGQVLVYHDVLGMGVGGPPPRFVKQYAQLATEAQAAIAAYADEVRSGVFPASAHSYKSQKKVATSLSAAATEVVQ